MLSCNRENMRLWVDALRSGKYPQTFDALRRRDKFGRTSFCVEGVAVAVARDNKVGGASFNCGVMPKCVAEWLGINQQESMCVMINGTWTWTTPLSLNDFLEWSFDRIADALEANYLPLTIDAPDDVSSVTAELVPV